MCGIAGIINLNFSPVDPKVLMNMNNAISHRGPDDEGYIFIDQRTSACNIFSGAMSNNEIKSKYRQISWDYKNPSANIGLAHRRFSIIDLTPSGHQPFLDKDRRCCIIYNGEIYNYIEIREELRKNGIRFVTDSDTEVLVESYKFYDTDFLSKLNGFWSFALYDFEKKILLLSRDRLGKKPLYYSKINNNICFASEIKSLLKVPEIGSAKKINEDVVYGWLSQGLRDLNFSTFYEGIYSFPSASWTVLNSSFPSGNRTFWKIPNERLHCRDISVDEARKNIRGLLEDSVRIRLRADVPLCVELSGGMDSSALVGIASSISGEKITTYTVEFSDKEWNEEPYAKSIAQHFNTEYRILQNPTDFFWKEISSFTYLEEEPYHSPNLHTNQAIWTSMRGEGIKVSLNGAAGDEVFAGYGDYFYYIQIENLKKLYIKEYLANQKWTENNSRIKSLLIPAKFYFIKKLKKFASYFDYGSKDFIKVKSSRERLEFNTLTEYLFSELSNTKIPYWLRSGDKGYMGIPLEVRAPFLDYRIVEYGASLPINYLIREGWHKWILRKSLEDLLPHDVLWRKRKMGFPFPYERFYKESEDIINLIVKSSANPYIDLNNSAIRKNWYAISFLLWYEFFFNENTDLFKKIEESVNNKIYSYRFRPSFIETYTQLKNGN